MSFLLHQVFLTSQQANNLASQKHGQPMQVHLDNYNHDAAQCQNNKIQVIVIKHSTNQVLSQTSKTYSKKPTNQKYTNQFFFFKLFLKVFTIYKEAKTRQNLTNTTSHKCFFAYVTAKAIRNGGTFQNILCFKTFRSFKKIS
eukprot:EC096034.1.p3 GENE.EC096034.1~~EC096034.1.p3  ORF type:complete len:142 (-),score=18.56 EC096034.1:17-442(-)